MLSWPLHTVHKGHDCVIGLLDVPVNLAYP